jgi:chromosome segregation ATPase
MLMPRKNADEVIADLEQKLEEAKARVNERRNVRADQLRKAIEVARAQVTKAEDKVTTLVLELDELLHEITGTAGPDEAESEPVQPELEPEPEPEPAPAKAKAKATAGN